MRNLNPSVFGYKQSIMYNERLDFFAEEEEDDIAPSLLLSNLEDFDNQFELIAHSNKELDDDHILYESLEDFDTELYERSVLDWNEGGVDTKTRYGSYYIMEANNRTKSFKVATFVNITIQDAAAYHPQFIYQAILRTATGNPDYIFNVTTTPVPVSPILRAREGSSNAIFICLISGIGFALIPSSAVGNIVSER